MANSAYQCSRKTGEQDRVVENIGEKHVDNSLVFQNDGEELDKIV
jgi:hypothetical protein